MTTISTEAAVRRLKARYEEQALKFPRMRSEIPLALYVKRSLNIVRANGMLVSYDTEAERCPTCGAPVNSIFDHVDVDCAAP